MCICRNLICLISLVLVLSLAGSAHADLWTDGNGTGIWNDDLNWDTGAVPAGTNVVIDSLPGPSVQAAGMTAHYINLGDDITGAPSTSGLTIDGGDLSSFYLNIGHSAGQTGTVTINSGAMSAQWVNVGRFGTGTLTMNGGTFTGTGGIWLASNSATEPGHIQLNDGTVNAGSSGFWMGDSGAPATMDIEAGTLIVDTDYEATIQGFIDNGWITAYGGAGTLQLDYDSTNPGQTTLSAVPEPGTIALLGCAGLALLLRGWRRKR